MRLLKKTHHNQVARRTICTKTVRVFVATLSAMAVFITQAFSSARTQVVYAAETAGCRINFVEWNRVKRQSPEYDFYGMIMWERGGTYYYAAGAPDWQSDPHGGSIPGRKAADNPYISEGGDQFVTRDTLDVLYFDYQKNDGDNGSGRRYYLHPRGGVTPGDIWWGRYICVDGGDLDWDDDKDLWTVIGKDNKGSVPENYVWIFYNRSAGTDTQMKIDNNLLYCDRTSDWVCSDLILYVASNREYTGMGNCTIQKDQITRIENDVILLDGNTMTIEEGAVVSVVGNFFNNGKIDCKGTLIVQKNAVMMPFTPSGAAGEINLHDGGTMIVMSGARALGGLPAGHLNSTSNGKVVVGEGGTVINFGLTALGRVELRQGGTIENHEGARMFLGYSVEKKFATFLSTAFDAKSSASKLGLTNSGTSVTMSGGTIKAFAGSGLTNASTSGSCTYYSYDSNGKASRYDNSKL